MVALDVELVLFSTPANLHQLFVVCTNSSTCFVYIIGPSLPQGVFDVFDNSRFKLLSNPDLTVDENMCLKIEIERNI